MRLLLVAVVVLSGCTLTIDHKPAPPTATTTSTTTSSTVPFVVCLTPDSYTYKAEKCR